MKDETLREQFDRVAKGLTEQRRNRMLARVLGCLRDSVQEMQDNGYAITLELRMRDGCAPLHLTADDRKQVAANGSIRFGEGGPALEFILLQKYADTMYFKAYIGTQEVISHYAHGDDLALMQKGMLHGLMIVQAEHEMVAQFNLGDRNGKTAMIGKTVLPKPPSNS